MSEPEEIDESRRRFLRNAALGTAGLVAGGAAIGAGVGALKDTTKPDLQNVWAPIPTQQENIKHGAEAGALAVPLAGAVIYVAASATRLGGPEQQEEQPQPEPPPQKIFTEAVRAGRKAAETEPGMLPAHPGMY
jgi:hypothetical protein